MPVNVKLDLYNSVNRIPFSLMIGNYIDLPETIYSRNLKDGNFIEFRFEKESMNLYEMTMVNINSDTIKNQPLDDVIKIPEVYQCSLVEIDSILDDSLPMEIIRDKSSICFNLSLNDSSQIRYFDIGGNCALGVNAESFLTSVYINNLSQESIINILGSLPA